MLRLRDAETIKTLGYIQRVVIFYFDKFCCFLAQKIGNFWKMCFDSVNLTIFYSVFGKCCNFFSHCTNKLAEKSQIFQIK